MQIKFRHIHLDAIKSFQGPIYICFLWLASLSLGAYIATLNPPTTNSLMLTLNNSRMSIVSLVIVAILPFVLSAIVLKMFSWPLLIPIVILKGYCLGFISSLVCISFSGAGWLLRWLLIFTDSILVVMQLYLWIQSSMSHSKQDLSKIFTYIIWALVFVCIDHYCIYPFVLSLLKCSF